MARGKTWNFVRPKESDKVIRFENDGETFSAVEPMCILDLVLTYKWYDMITSGEKPDEYRDFEKWYKRVMSKPYTHVRFHRGYTSTTALYRIASITSGIGNPAWGAPENKKVIIIHLGGRY